PIGMDPRSPPISDWSWHLARRHDLLRKTMRNAVSHSRNGQAKRQKVQYSTAEPNGAQLRETFDAVSRTLADLPTSDNAAGAVDRMLQANAILRHLPWPKPFDVTVHRVRCGDARDLSWIESESVHLVVT